MAKDKTVKLKIRAYYESHDVTYRQLFNHFKEYDVSQKTMEYWGREEEWQKAKYQDLAAAVDEIYAGEIVENIESQVDALIKRRALGSIKDKNAEDYFANEISKELLFSATNKHFLAKEMVENLNRAKSFAVVSKSIGTNKVYHEMLTSTYATLHGRQTNIGVVNPNVRDTQTLENMSNEELLELLED